MWLLFYLINTLNKGEVFMCKENNLDLNRVAQRREELDVVLKWKIVPMLKQDTEYRITIAYNPSSSKQENIKVLGFYKGSEVGEEILRTFDKYLNDTNSFGILAESKENDDVKNWEITFSRAK
jgi:hypothetical protein